MDPRLQDISHDHRLGLFRAMAETLAHIHNTDLAVTGLNDYGASGAYFDRALARWIKQYRASETQTYPDLEALMDWLGQHLPPDDTRPALIHGDYRLDNLLIDPADLSIQGVVDWELSTTGHPLSDLDGRF